jgi:hypothetical protein
MIEDKQKQELIEEIRRRIEYLVSTDEISDDEKVAIARNALNILDSGDLTKEELKEVVQ